MTNLILIAVGGAVGALGRYGVVSAASATVGASYYGTLTVNVLGSLAMGLLAGAIMLGVDISEGARLALAVGVLGAFTTFSAFSLDVFTLVDEGRIAAAAAYAALSVVASIGALFLGVGIARGLAAAF